MAFKRREGLAGGLQTEFVDTNLVYCPFCGKFHPQWTTDAYIVKFNMIGALCINGYQFQCPTCKGIVEFQGNNDWIFKTKGFTKILFVHPGNGKYNHELIGKETTLVEIIDICSKSPAGEATPTPETVVEEPAPVVEEPAPVVEEPKPVVEEPKPVVEEPAPTPVAKPTPNTVPPAPKKPNLLHQIFGIISMIFGITGLVMNSIGTILSCIPYTSSIGLGFAITFIQFSIVGLVFGIISKKKSSIVLSAIGLGLGVLSLLISIIVTIILLVM